MSGGLLAGAARASIAPRAEDMRAGVYLGGFGSYRQRRVTSVLDEPQCRAIACSDGASAFVLAALDLVGASGPLLAEIRADAARLTGLPPHHILLACTHSHASPDLQGLWGGVPDGYRTHIAHRVAATIRDAHEAMVPARVAASTRTPAGLAALVANRRGWPATDATLTTVRLDTPAGGPIATITNYACHPTAIGPNDARVSRDWCGFAVDAIEAATGGVALYVNGAIGDVNPARSGGVEAAQALGEAVAREAIDAFADAEDAGDTIAITMQAVEIPMHAERLSARVQDAISRGGFALNALSKVGGLHAASVALHAAGRGDLAQMVAALAGMSERGIVRRDTRTFVPTYCGHLAIGSGLEALVAPGEVLTRLALPLRASMGARHRLFLGLTHDTLGYFLPEDEWGEAGRGANYEESVSLGKHAGTVLADALLQLVPQRQEPA